MIFSYRYLNHILGYAVMILLPMTLIIYLLRGLGILGNMAGGVILLLLLSSLLTGISYLLAKTR